MLRRCTRPLVVLFVAVSFIVNASLLLVFMVADDSVMRPCQGGQDPVQVQVQSGAGGQVQGRSSSAVRQLIHKLPGRLAEKADAAAPASRRWQGDVDGLLRVLLTSRNQSLLNAQYQLNDLRASLRRIERHLDVYGEGESGADIRQPLQGYGTPESPVASEDKPALREPLSQPLQVGQPPGKTTEVAGLRGLSKALAQPLDAVVVNALKDVVAKYAATRRPRPKITVRHRSLHWKAQTAWEFFHNNITQYELYRSAYTDTPASSRSYVDDLLKDMASLPIVDIDEMTKKGTQIKLILKLSDRTKILFKPMRISKDVEANPNHFVFNEMERHHSEIAAFHLDRLFDFRRVPPVAGRYLNMNSEIRPFASRQLNKTFFISPAGNMCFYGECKYYCDSHHAVCGQRDVVEGSCAAFLPSDEDLPHGTWKNPWAQLYTKRSKLPSWKKDPRYCGVVRSEGPFDSGRRLLDVMDIAVFDFLIGNLDRHHYYTFEDFDNFTAPVLTDNGRGFGRARKDDVQLLAPIFQCCTIRASTLAKVVRFLLGDLAATSTGTGSRNGSSGRSLSAAMRESLSGDAIPGVLNAAHLTALDRRIRLTALVVYDCLRRNSASPDFSQVVVDDGF